MYVDMFYKLLEACPLSRRGFSLAKMCVSGFLDLHLSGLVRFVSDCVRFCQDLVMYLVPGVKGLPGGVDLVCHAGLDLMGIIMECRVTILAVSVFWLRLGQLVLCAL